MKSDSPSAKFNQMQTAVMIAINQIGHFAQQINISNKLDDLSNKIDINFSKLSQVILKTNENSLNIEKQLSNTIDLYFKKLFDQITIFQRNIILVDKNNRARINNQHVDEFVETEILEPLYSLKTGLILTNFPRTIKDLEKLSLNELKLLLEELDEVVPDGKSQRKQALKLALGMRRRSCAEALFQKDHINGNLQADLEASTMPPWINGGGRAPSWKTH
ncbi:hypothetical protein O181_020995 [Austropuccinia psidii MF-1]|uniref:Uncharacterized protein n=1 Tax=Austropuccinia psidii MF-1 TaxID=1389203 RepID=A0A9Q3CDQ8_9BASI|nr:hypothetical protein [Austropuccinia psidii MF-1]